jgi:hypothetical protein
MTLSAMRLLLYFALVGVWATSSETHARPPSSAQHPLSHPPSPSQSLSPSTLRNTSAPLLPSPPLQLHAPPSPPPPFPSPDRIWNAIGLQWSHVGIFEVLWVLWPMLSLASMAISIARCTLRADPLALVGLMELRARAVRGIHIAMRPHVARCVAAWPLWKRRFTRQSTASLHAKYYESAELMC